MKFVLVREGHVDEADVTETLQEIQNLLQERYDEDPSYFEEYTRTQYKIFPLGEEIPFSFRPARISIDAVNTEIPPPLPGETVTDYAARITNR